LSPRQAAVDQQVYFRDQGLFSGTKTVPDTRPAMESLDAVVRGNRTSWSRGAASEIPSPKSEFMRSHNRPRTLRQLSDEAMESSQSSEDLFLKLADDADERTRHAHPVSPTSQLPVSQQLTSASN
jgi:hypothetical protein